jgi:beta-lactamase regulating signal transducer with metallopeptidase domain
VTLGALFPAIAAASIRAMVLAAVALLLLCIFLRKRNAAMEHAVWTAVLLGMLVMPALPLLLPSFSVRLLPPEPNFSAWPTAAAGDAPLTVYSRRSDQGVVPVKAAARDAAGHWFLWVGALYFAVFCGLLARLGIGYVLTLRLIRGSRRVDESAIHALVTGLPGELTLSKALVLLESPRVMVPVTAGWLRPKVLLPANWRDWSGWKQRAILAHELSHVRRRDWLVSLAAALNKCLFWFHPLAWWLESKLFILAEHSSDSASLETAGNPPAYAQMILDMAAAVASNGSRLVWQRQAITGRLRLDQRIDRILGERCPEKACLSRASWTTVALCSIPLLCATAAIRLERPQSKVESQPLNEAFNEMKLLIEGWGLKPADAERSEERVKRNPEDLHARGLLLSYYFQNAIRYPRVEHVFWLIEHHPDSRLLEMRGAAFSRVKGNPLNTDADYERAKMLWLRQVQRYPGNKRVLIHAIDFLTPSDLPLAEKLIRRAKESNPQEQEWTARLAALYARVISSAEITEPADLPRNPWADRAFVEQAKELLQTSNDAMLIGLAGERLADKAEMLRRGQMLLAESPRNAHLVEGLRRGAAFGESLLLRAQSLEPGNPKWTEKLRQLEKVNN